MRDFVQIQVIPMEGKIAAIDQPLDGLCILVGDVARGRNAILNEEIGISSKSRFDFGSSDRSPFEDGLDHEPDGDSLDTIGLLELLGVYDVAPGSLFASKECFAFFLPKEPFLKWLHNNTGSSCWSCKAYPNITIDIMLLK